MNKIPSIGVAVLTYNSASHLKQCLPPLIESPLNPKVLVLDSTSHDRTVEIALNLGAIAHIIPQSDFNHGMTRELARKILKTDIVVMVTPDAYAIDNRVLEKLVEPILKGRADVAYARQIPKDGASFFEAFPREFNYPARSQIRSIDDIGCYGVYTFFCSDSFAAYSNQALDEIGGFKHVLVGEDTVAAAELLRKGKKIAYVSEAVVKHSHDYSLKLEFKRYFDTGFARKSYGHLLACQGGDGARGKAFFKSMCKRLWKENPYLLPYAFMQTGVKWLGYQIGKRASKAPLWVLRRFSSQPYFFKAEKMP